MKKLFVGLCFLVAMYAQSVSVDLVNKVGIINRLSLNDLNLAATTQKTAPDIFSATMTITGVTGKGYSGVFTVEILRDGIVLFEVKSKSLPNIVDGNDTWDSSDLGKSLTWPKSGGTKLSFNAKGVGDFKPTAASLPDGVYSIKLTIALSGGPDPLGDDAEVVIGNIVNNFALTLNTPEDDGTIINGTPTFTWTSGIDLSKLDDKENKEALTIYVYEIQGSETQSASLARNPILKEKFSGKTTSFTFPSNNPRALEAGKSYYWTLKAKLNVLGGGGTAATEIAADNINRFTYPATNSANAFVEMQIEGLEEIMGAQYGKVMASLNGYRLKSAKFMGIPVSSSGGSKILEGFTAAMKKVGAKIIINY